MGGLESWERGLHARWRAVPRWRFNIDFLFKKRFEHIISLAWPVSHLDLNKGFCFIETKNLDGESNLKSKMANNDLQKLFDFQDILKSKDYVIYLSYQRAPNLLN